MVQNNYPRIISEEWEWSPLHRQNLVPHYLIEIQTSPPQGHPALASALKPILVVTGWSGRHIEDCYRRDDIVWDAFQTGDYVACAHCESHQ